MNLKKRHDIQAAIVFLQLQCFTDLTGGIEQVGVRQWDQLRFGGCSGGLQEQGRSGRFGRSRLRIRLAFLGEWSTVQAESPGDSLFGANVNNRKADSGGRRSCLRMETVLKQNRFGLQGF